MFKGGVRYSLLYISMSENCIVIKNNSNIMTELVIILGLHWSYQAR